MSDKGDAVVIACNFVEGTSECAKGALAYVDGLNYGNGLDRNRLLARSRSGRWIEKWEAIWRLDNFRLKKIPPEHPLYPRLALHAEYPSTQEAVDALKASRAREVARREGRE